MMLDARRGWAGRALNTENRMPGRRIRLTSAAFEGLVAEALDDLPDWVRERMENLAIIVEPWPTREQLHKTGTSRGSLLLGLYEGIPLPQRGRGYNLVAPDRITLFQGSLELVADSRAALVRLIRHTVIHEIAHYLGFSEEEIRGLGY
jgi:predicted Zn-dependent protease with MMP-like domain